MAKQENPFRSNSALPAVGSVYNYTVAEIQEFLKCSKDPVYFIKTYMKIIHVDKGLVPFELYPFQEKMIRSYYEHRFNITMTSRQSGKSTTVIGFFLHYILFNVNVNACISANKQKLAGELLGRLKLAYENLPRFLQQGVVKWAQLEIELENGARVFAAATSSSAVRGGSYNLILLDEFAHVPENMANEFYASTFPTISSGKTTKVIMISTPLGMNLFHKFWADAIAGRNDFKPIQVKWDEVPGRDEAWKQTEIRNIGGKEVFEAEYECSFLSSSYTLIDAHILSNLPYDEPLLEEANGYHEFVAPIKDHTYIITVDTATGQGKDSSAFSIIDVTVMPYRVAATFQNNRIKTMEYPAVIENYAQKFNEAWILIEINDIGRDIANILFGELGYGKVITTTMKDKRQGQKLAFGNGRDRHMGVRMTAGVKKSGCGILKALIENKQLIISDYRHKMELSTFVQNGRVYEALKNHHDDLTMTLVVFAWATLQPGFGNITPTRSIDDYTKILQTAGENGDLTSPNYNGGDVDSQPLGMVDTDDDDPDTWLLKSLIR